MSVRYQFQDLDGYTIKVQTFDGTDDVTVCHKGNAVMILDRDDAANLATALRSAVNDLDDRTHARRQIPGQLAFIE